MAEKITRDQLSKDTFSGAVDANGWSVEIRPSGKKTYRKIFTGTLTTNIPVNGVATLLNGSALPSAITSLSGHICSVTPLLRWSAPFSVFMEASGNIRPELSTALKVVIWNGHTSATAPSEWALSIIIDEL